MQNIFIHKTELAQAYFPLINLRSARHNLMRMINSNPELLQKLKAYGYTDTTHIFSPRQLELIFEYLGNPF